MHSIIDRNTIVGRPPPAQRTLKVLNAGAHRGAEENLPAYVEYNGRSSSASVQPVYIDPRPGRAVRMKEIAERRGVPAEAIEGRIEDVLASGDAYEGMPLVANLDRSSAVASAFKARGVSRRAMLGYMVVRFPNKKLWAIRFALQADDAVARKEGLAFFERLADISERNTSATVIGAEASPAHVLAERVIRRWFADHCDANLANIAAGIEPTSNVFEATPNGKDTYALHIVVGDTWSDPEALARAVVENPSSPIRRGVQFVVCEIAGPGLRLHEVRRRTDNRITVHGADTLDRAAIEAQARAEVEAATRAKREAERRQLAATTTPADLAPLVAFVGLAATALSRAERTTASRTNPVQTTD